MRCVTLAALLALLGGCNDDSPAPTPPQPQPTKAELPRPPHYAGNPAETWLHVTCSNPDGTGPDSSAFNKLVERLRAEGGPSIVFFRRAFAQGPPRARIKAARDAARREFKVLREHLARERPGVPPAHAARLRDLTEQQYIARTMMRFRHAYKSNAISGLGVIGTPDAIQALKAIQQDTPRLDAEMRALIAKAIHGR